MSSFRTIGPRCPDRADSANRFTRNGGMCATFHEVSSDDMRAAAQQIYQLGAKAVLVKGGGMAGNLRGVDVWFDGSHLETLHMATVETSNPHGTGCTLSAAIAANLALGQNDLLIAAKTAKAYVTTALRYALDLGQGQGPVGHFFPLLERSVYVDSSCRD